jgi:iron(III) transport system permease protein
VIFPLLRPAVVSGWLILFVMFMREVAISNLLYEGGNSTLSVALRSVSSLEPDGVVAAFTLLQVALFLLIAGLALLVGGSRRTMLRLPT